MQCPAMPQYMYYEFKCIIVRSFPLSCKRRQLHAYINLIFYERGHTNEYFFVEMDYEFVEKLKEHEVMQHETCSLVCLVNHERPKVWYITFLKF